MLVEMAKCFGKYGLGEQFLAVVFPFFYFPWLAFRKEVKFLDPDERKEPIKSTVREWTDAIIFAVVSALFSSSFTPFPHPPWRNRCLLATIFL